MKNNFRRVIVESPFAGEVERNKGFAIRCLLDCKRRGEAPFASHVLYALTEVAKDSEPAERQLGIEMGLAWGRVADATVVYCDHGITPGMLQGIERAIAEGRPVEHRYLFDPDRNDPPDVEVVKPTPFARRERVAQLLLEIMGIELNRPDLPEWRDLEPESQNQLLRAAGDLQDVVTAWADLADLIRRRGTGP